MPLILFSCRICLGILHYSAIFEDPSQKIKIQLLLLACLFFKSRNSGFLNPTNIRVWSVYFFFISWSYLINFISFYEENLEILGGYAVENNEFSRKKVFWTLWSFTVGFTVLVPFFQSKLIQKQSWMRLFKAPKHILQKLEEKQKIYLICNQYYEKLQTIKRS